jgi:hypothetical protein
MRIGEAFYNYKPVQCELVGKHTDKCECGDIEKAPDKIKETSND